MQVTSRSSSTMSIVIKRFVIALADGIVCLLCPNPIKRGCVTRTGRQLWCHNCPKPL